MEDLDQLKRDILSYAEEGVVKYFNLSRDDAKLKVESSSIEASFNRAPDVVAHYSQEQLVHIVMR